MNTQLKEQRLLQLEKSKASADRRFNYVVAGITFFLLLFVIVKSQAQSKEKKIFNNVNADGVILDGYDPVAFFTDNKPAKGIPQFQFKYDGAVYHFASQEHADAFKADPEKYKPQFGGWCAYAVSLGRVAPIDVNTFSIVNGRLVIQHNQRAVNGWNKDVQGNLALADKYWPKVSEKAGNKSSRMLKNPF